MIRLTPRCKDVRTIRLVPFRPYRPLKCLVIVREQSSEHFLWIYMLSSTQLYEDFISRVPFCSRKSQLVTLIVAVFKLSSYSRVTALESSYRKEQRNTYKKKPRIAAHARRADRLLFSIAVSVASICAFTAPLSRVCLSFESGDRLLSDENL